MSDNNILSEIHSAITIETGNSMMVHMLENFVLKPVFMEFKHKVYLDLVKEPLPGERKILITVIVKDLGEVEDDTPLIIKKGEHHDSTTSKPTNT